MTPLLARQLRKHLPDIDPNASPWREFLAAVDGAYEGFAQEHAFLEHTLEVASAELTEANERLRREAETQLASLSRYYLQTLELQQGMILCVRRTPRGFEHTLCRGQLLTRLGLAPADIEGRLVEEVAPPSQAAELNAAYARAWAGEALAFPFTTSEGLELFVLMRLRDAGSAVQEVIASCVEITALKEAERELRAAKERAEAADRAKSEFLAVMSHEIRTPLNAVLGFSALLQQSSITPEQQSWLKIIGESGESLLALINDILDFSKIEAGRFTLHLEPVELPVLLDQIASMFRTRAQTKRLKFDVACEPASPSAILSDPQRLKQILVNLVANAVKFTPHGAIRVHARLDPPDAHTPSHDRKLRVSVHDTGIGIPADRRDRLFKPFSQVDSSTTRTYGGTGLGLAICDRLVRLLGGEISVESEFGRGSTFSFWVRAPLAHDIPDIAPAAPSAPALPPADATRILVAEDQPQNRDLIRRILQTRGYGPTIVANGREAVAAAARENYDLILLDLRMPEMDGYEAARAIRSAVGANPQPKIYALTASTYAEDRARCNDVGMNGILTKPINFQQLFETIAAAKT